MIWMLTPVRQILKFCSETFLEFIWRFWVENEIWHKRSLKEQPPLTFAETDYLNHYEAAP